jgi:hypothetical protein
VSHQLPKFSLLLGSCLLLGDAIACGQTTAFYAIPNGRPAINSGTDLIPPRTIQFENGFSWSNDGRSRTIDGPESLMRIGLTRRFELQVTLPNLHIPRFAFDDLALGVKTRIGSETRTWPVAMVATIRFPTGSTEVTSGGVDPTLFLATSHTLSHDLQFSSSLDLASLSAIGESRTLRSDLALDLGWCFKPDRCIFLEGAPFLASGTGNSGVTTDAGMALRLAPHLPVDWRVGTTVQAGETSVFISVGYSFRQTRNPTDRRLPYPRLAADSTRSRTP